MSQTHPNPVLLVHGIFRKAGIFRVMSAYLRAQGWSVWALNLSPNLGQMGLDQLAEQLADYIDKTFPPEQSIDIVGLSMGGIVSRYYLQRLGGVRRVQRFVTIASPHNGTLMAHLLPGTGCLQMRPGSAFLADLNRDAAMLRKLNFTSIWTPWDFIIVPAISSQMPEAKNVQVSVFAHAMMARDRRCLEVVAAALRENGGEN